MEKQFAPRRDGRLDGSFTSRCVVPREARVVDLGGTVRAAAVDVTLSTNEQELAQLHG
jgi:hypothetical protein